MEPPAAAWTHGRRATVAPPESIAQTKRGSLHLGSLAGIRIDVHITFLMLLAWIGISHVAKGHGLTETLAGFVLILSIFTLVVLHELGHALMARHFGIATTAITLLPIGGIAQLTRMPERPREELLVALAGPAVNVALAGLFFFAGALAHLDIGITQLALVGGPFLTKLAWINVTLAIFNLLPAFPMDGGRVLRAALAMRMDRVRATAIAAVCGQAMAVVFGIVGFWSNPMLVLIAVFVWFGAQEEARSVVAASLLGGVTVREAMLREFRTLAPSDTVGDAAALTLLGFQADFPVIQGESVVGIVTRADVLRGLSSNGATTPVAETMHRSFVTVQASEPLDDVLPRLHGQACDVYPVLQEGSLVGILRLENVGELLAFRAATKHARRC
jgi:Zn-dependent protease